MHKDLDVMCMKLGQWQGNKVKIEEKIEEIKREIIEAVGTVKKGTKSATGRRYSATTTTKLTRTVDQNAYNSLVLSLKSEDISKYFKCNVSVNNEPYAKLFKKDRELYTTLSDCITSKPAKIGITIKDLHAKERA